MTPSLAQLLLNKKSLTDWPTNKAFMNTTGDWLRTSSGKVCCRAILHMQMVLQSDGSMPMTRKDMKPSTGKGTGPFKESMVEMKLEAITMKQLVDTLYRVEASGGLIVIKRISITGNKKETGYLDAIFQVLTFHQA